MSLDRCSSTCCRYLPWAAPLLFLSRLGETHIAGRCWRNVNHFETKTNDVNINRHTKGIKQFLLVLIRLSTVFILELRKNSGVLNPQQISEWFKSLNDVEKLSSSWFYCCWDKSPYTENSLFSKEPFPVNHQTQYPYPKNKSHFDWEKKGIQTKESVAKIKANSNGRAQRESIA